METCLGNANYATAISFNCETVECKDEYPAVYVTAKVALARPSDVVRLDVDEIRRDLERAVKCHTFFRLPAQERKEFADLGKGAKDGK